MKTLPSFVRTLCALFLGTFGLLLIARLAMLGLVWANVAEEPTSDLLYALYVGCKFDCRITIFMLIPLMLGLGIPACERALVENRNVRKTVTFLYGILFFGLALVYVVDFGYFFYLHQRVDASLVEFLGNPEISGEMVWQSYPVIWITLGLLTLVAGYTAFVGWLLGHHTLTPLSFKRRAGWSCAVFVAAFGLAYGQISSNLFPLRWSNAYFSTNKDLALLALNPVQNLRDTSHSAQGTRPNIDATRDSYPRIAAWLGIPNPDPQKLTFTRSITADPQTPKRNVVVIIMESMTWARSSFAPNLTAQPASSPLVDPTPTLRELANDSMYFPNYYAPARTTARAIFTALTGIPDVNRSGGTSSRNPALVDQTLLINEFKGYEKYYLIGGSASWANIRGVLTHNIEGLHLMEEGAWKSPNVDVWGISDLALFQESAEVLTASKQPFVAVIQTAGFHRPYTIPDENAGFKTLEPSKEILTNYGYTGADEYNSLRFSDHALGEFFRIARTKPWFSNTVFAIFGDHGLNDPSRNMTPGYLACSLQSNHVPMLLYAPGLVPDESATPLVQNSADAAYKPGIYPQPAGHTDIFPTVAALTGISYKYNGLGRNLLDPNTRQNAKQFIAGNEEAYLRLVEDGYCYIRESSEGLYRLDDPELRNLLNEEPERASQMKQTAQDFYNVSKYLLYNNKKYE